MPVTWSFEFMPPRGTDTIESIVDGVNACPVQPSFCCVTWKPGGVSREASLDLASKLPNGIMHLTATNLVYADVFEILNDCKARGVTTILVLRGDPVDGDKTPFATATNLVEFIRAHYGQYFRIGVAGYPEGFPPYSYEESLMFLKHKVDAGADFIITQLFFDAARFLTFQQDCRDIGIMCPIYPGVMPITSYSNLMHISNTCHISIPDELMNSPENVATYGKQICAKICQDLVDHGVSHIHVYTMNKLQNSIEMIQYVDDN